jgi:hypothetical protein
VVVSLVRCHLTRPLKRWITAEHCFQPDDKPFPFSCIPPPKTLAMFHGDCLASLPFTDLYIERRPRQLQTSSHDNLSDVGVGRRKRQTISGSYSSGTTGFQQEYMNLDLRYNNKTTRDCRSRGFPGQRPSRVCFSLSAPSEITRVWFYIIYPMPQNLTKNNF